MGCFSSKASTNYSPAESHRGRGTQTRKADDDIANHFVRLTFEDPPSTSAGQSVELRPIQAHGGLGTQQPAGPSRWQHEDPRRKFEDETARRVERQAAEYEEGPSHLRPPGSEEGQYSEHGVHDYGHQGGGGQQSGHRDSVAGPSRTRSKKHREGEERRRKDSGYRSSDKHYEKSGKRRDRDDE